MLVTTGEALRAWRQHSRCDLGVFRARQAQALADAGEPERAVVIAGEVAPLVAQTGSARMRAELLRLSHRMEPWRDEQVGHLLDKVLAGIPSRPGDGGG